jgi:DNA-binding NarL/FixJ family response regulator
VEATADMQKERVEGFAGSGRVPATFPRVLLVDDDEILREALCEMLTDRRFDVIGQAHSGAEGVSLAEEKQPDVVLMDFRMPGMDGLEATALIKANAPLTETILFTAYDDQSLNREAVQAGVYCVLVKGCLPELIVEALKGAVSRKRELQVRPT